MVDKKKKQVSSNFQAMVNAITKEFGDNTIYNAETFKPNETALQRVSCGNIELDIALGGGIPRGKIILVSGPFSSCKTYFVNKCLAEHTKLGEKVGILDEEFTYDDKWMQACGADTSLVWVGQAEYAERSLDLFEVLAGSGEFGALCIDSLAALIPQKTLDEAHEDAQMGIEAKLMSKALRKIIKAQHNLFIEGKVPPTIFLINQFRNKIGKAAMFGDPRTLPTGNAQHYYNSIWIDFNGKEDITNADDEVVGKFTEYYIKKNKTAPPRRKGLVSMFCEDFKGMKKGEWDTTGAIIDCAIRAGVVVKQGTFHGDPNNYKVSELEDELSKLPKTKKDEIKILKDEITKLKSKNWLFPNKLQYKKLWELLREEPKIENAILRKIKEFYADLNLATGERNIEE